VRTREYRLRRGAGAKRTKSRVTFAAFYASVVLVFARGYNAAGQKLVQQRVTEAGQFSKNRKNKYAKGHQSISMGAKTNTGMNAFFGKNKQVSF
jgi:hypothetical protein